MTLNHLDRICEAYLTAQYQLSLQRQEFDDLEKDIEHDKTMIEPPVPAWQLAKMQAMIKRSGSLRSLIHLREKEVRNYFDKIVHILNILHNQTARVRAVEPVTGKLAEFEFSYRRTNNIDEIEWKLVG